MSAMPGSSATSSPNCWPTSNAAPPPTRASCVVERRAGIGEARAEAAGEGLERPPDALRGRPAASASATKRRCARTAGSPAGERSASSRAAPASSSSSPRRDGAVELHPAQERLGDGIGGAGGQGEGSGERVLGPAAALGRRQPSALGRDRPALDAVGRVDPHRHGAVLGASTRRSRTPSPGTCYSQATASSRGTRCCTRMWLGWSSRVLLPLAKTVESLSKCTGRRASGSPRPAGPRRPAPSCRART